MSREEALKILGISAAELSATAESDPALRRAYHRMASKYHPDKNPDPSARDVFEKVQNAYELITESRSQGGPDARNISLMLQAQGILYRRCAAKLRPFKYSGYPLLLRVIATVDESTGEDSVRRAGQANPPAPRLCPLAPPAPPARMPVTPCDSV